MPETTYIPVTLESVIAAGRHNTKKRTGTLYCRDCVGETGDLSEKYGSLILESTIEELGIAIEKHDPSHKLTAVEDVCGGGLF